MIKPVTEDEIILMIHKGNKEALELLFSLYEKKIRFEANQFEKKYSKLCYSVDDFYQEISECFINTLFFYDYHIAKFYTYFMCIMNRKINKLCIRDIKRLNYNNSIKIDFDNVDRRLEIDEEVYFSDYESNFRIEKIAEFMKEDFSKERQIAIKMWMVGYSYKEISSYLNLTQQETSILINVGLKKLKNHLKHF